MTDDSATPAQPAGTAATAEPVLELEGLTSGYNSSAVLRDISLTVRPGEVVALTASLPAPPLAAASPRGHHDRRVAFCRP